MRYDVLCPLLKNAHKSAALRAINAFVSNTRPGQQTIENHCAQERAPAAERALACNGFLQYASPSQQAHTKNAQESAM